MFGDWDICSVTRKWKGDEVCKWSPQPVKQWMSVFTHLRKYTETKFKNPFFFTRVGYFNGDYSGLFLFFLLSFIYIKLHHFPQRTESVTKNLQIWTFPVFSLRGFNCCQHLCTVNVPMENQSISMYTNAAAATPVGWEKVKIICKWDFCKHTVLSLCYHFGISHFFLVLR